MVNAKILHQPGDLIEVGLVLQPNGQNISARRTEQGRMRRNLLARGCLGA
jgi:hypothetical protein